MKIDVVDFNDGNWGGWVSDVEKGELKLEGEEGQYFLQYTSSEVDSYERTLVTRKFEGLEAGNTYFFHLDAAVLDAAGTGKQQLGLGYDGKPVTDWFDIADVAWRELCLNFQAVQTSHALSVVYKFEPGEKFTNGNFHIQSISLYDTTTRVDHADFSEGRWNGWRKLSNGQYLELLQEEDGKYYLGLDERTFNGNVTGAVISKNFNLDAGKIYELEAVVRKGQWPVKVADKFHFSSSDVNTEGEIPASGHWQSLKFKLENPPSSEVILYVMPHIAEFASGVVLDNFVFNEQLDDLTDFSGDDLDTQMNEWKLNPQTTYGAEIITESGEGNVLKFPTHGEQTNAGVILTKQYRLIVGRTYRVLLRIRAVNMVQDPQIRMIAGEQSVLQVEFDGIKWCDVYGEFVADTVGTTLTIINDLNDSRGNDYNISRIQLTEQVPGHP